MALTIPNRFTNGQTVDAAKFNSNFDTISTWASGIETDLDTAEAAIDVIEAGYGACAFHANATVDQTIGVTTYTTVTLSDSGTGGFDNGGCFTSNTYTPTVAGAYQLSANVNIKNATLASGVVYLFISKNGATQRHWVCALEAGGSLNGSIVLKANGVTDAFTVEVYSTADSVDIDSAQFSGFCVKPD